METKAEKRVERNDWDLVYYESLYKELSQNLQSYANYFLEDIELSITIVNDIFIQLWYSKIKPQNVKAYLYTSVKNKALTQIGKNKKGIITYLNPPDLNLLAENQADFSVPQDESDKIEFINQLINQLPKKRKIVFTLFRFEGFSYAEIAELLQISTRTVEDHLVKAMQFLHEHTKHLIDD